MHLIICARCLMTSPLPKKEKHNHTEWQEWASQKNQDEENMSCEDISCEDPCDQDSCEADESLSIVQRQKEALRRGARFVQATNVSLILPINQQLLAICALVSFLP